MGSRWFIPLSLLVFGAMIAGLWSYLAATEEAPPRSWARIEPEVVESQSRADQSVDSVQPVAQVQSQIARRVKRPTQRAILPDVMEQLDDATLHLRSSLVEHGGLEVARARRELESGDFEAAIRSAEKVLSSSRNNTAALAVRAAALAGQSKWAEAERAYVRLIQVAPNDQSARYNFGVLLYRKERFGEASEQFRELLAINPEHAQGLYNLATLAQRDGRTTEAKEALLKFVALRPAVPSGWFNLGVLYMDVEETEEAGRCFAIFHSLAPEDAAGAANLARSLMAGEQIENAYELLTSCYVENPCDLAILEGLRDVSAMLGDSYPAREPECRRLALSMDEQIAAAER